MIIKSILNYIISGIMFFLLFIMVLTAVALISTGITASAVSLAVITGVFKQVASDLSPVPMFFTGISCLSMGLALALAVTVLFPKQVKLFKS